MTKTQLFLLYAIYRYRCLNEELLSLIAKKDDIEQDISDLIQKKYIRKEQYKIDQYAYLITKEGIDALRIQKDIPSEIYDIDRGVKRGYYRASELDLHPKYINHQIHTNKLIILIEEELKKRSIAYRFYNEKEASKYPNIRPDGIISFSNIDLFIEMDMSTESRKQLGEKWERYRQFLSSPSFLYKERNIIVLFAVAGTSQEHERIQLVKKTIYEGLMDLLLKDIDFFVGNIQTIIDVLEKRIIPKTKEQDTPLFFIKKTLEDQHGFSVSKIKQETFKEVLDSPFSLYARKTENKQIVSEQGRLQEFFVDDYFFCPTRTMSKVLYIEKISSIFRAKYKRTLHYLIVGKNEKEIYEDLKMMNVVGHSNVFFSTYARLKQKPFHEAIFQFDTFGNIHHFKNNGLSERVFEEHIDQL